MKINYLILIFSVSLFSCNNNSDTETNSDNTETIEEVELYNGIPISKEEPDNYTGEYLELYKNDLPKMRGHKVDGIRQGKWQSWHFTGAIASEANYIDGKEDGLYTVYHDNGKIRHQGFYEMGIKKGSWKFFTEEGDLAIDTVFNP